MRKLRRMMRCVVVVAVASGCFLKHHHLPKSLGEQSSGYGYVPLDALGIEEVPDSITCPSNSKFPPFVPLLDALPDISVRFAVASVSDSAGISFGPAKVTSAGQSYRAVLDYINNDAVPVDFYLRELLEYTTPDSIVETSWQSIDSHLGPKYRIVGYQAQAASTSAATNKSALFLRVEPHPFNTAGDTGQEAAYGKGYSLVTIPIYVGIGMRLTADVRALKGSVGLTSLSAIGASAELNELSGTLTVQTLGITGKSVATALPLPNKLDQTTVENGLLALGSSRAIIYTAGEKSSDVRTNPRVVGLYSPVGSDPRLINAVYSALSRSKPGFLRKCIEIPTIADSTRVVGGSAVKRKGSSDVPAHRSP